MILKDKDSIKTVKSIQPTHATKRLNQILSRNILYRIQGCSNIDYAKFYHVLIVLLRLVHINA